MLEQKESEHLQQAIDKLAAETKSTPLTHESWEVVDSLRETMRVRAEESLMAASKAQDALDRLGEDRSKTRRRSRLSGATSSNRKLLKSLRKLSKSGRFWQRRRSCRRNCNS